MQRVKEDCQKNWFEYFTTVTVNLLTMTAAIGLAWTNPMLPKLKSENPEPLKEPLTHYEESWVASLLSAGIFLATISSGVIADKIGRKKTLILYSLPMVTADILLFFANHVVYLYIARALVGIGVGCVWTVTPLYTAEIAKTENRGFVSVLLVVMTSGAQLFLYCIGPFVSMAIIALITLGCTTLFLVLCILFVPESPYYYAISKQPDKVEKILVKLRRTDDIKEELSEILKSVEQAKVRKTHEESWTQIFKSKSIRKALLIVVGLLFYQQNTGTVPLTLFLQDIFNASKSKLRSDLCVIVVTIVQFIILLLVSKVIDLVARKLLLIISIIGVICSLLPLGLYFFFQERNYNMDAFFWLPVSTVIFYNIFYNIGIGPLAFVIAGEIFPTNHLRTYLNGIAFTTFILIGFSLSFFPTIGHLFGIANIILFFTSVTCTCLVFIIFVIPETKGKTFSEIQVMLEEGRLK